MKKIYLLLSMILVYATAFSQSLSPILTGCSGGENDNASYLTSWSIGEVIIGTGSAGTSVLTQGFQQGFSPITIAGMISLCVNSGYYYYSTQPGMSNYSWSITGGSIYAGAGTYQVQVSWTTPGSQSISVNYTNTWGFRPAMPVALNVTVNPVPDPSGPVSGTANVCAGATGVSYSVAPVGNAMTYVWTLPTNASIVSGAGTNSITVNYANNAISGNITVIGNNLCGYGTGSPPFAVSVSPLPDAAGAISGPAFVCERSNGIVYSVATIANASTYNWTVPSGVNIVGGLNTNVITVNFGPAAVSGNFTVAGINTCGNGTNSTLAVTVTPYPNAPTITSLGNVLTSSSPTGNQWYFNNMIMTGETGQTCTAHQSGWYWDEVIVNGCSSDTSNHIKLIMIGVGGSIQDADIVLYPNPNDGAFTLGFTSLKEEKYSVKVFNSLGICVFKLNELNVSGITNQGIDLRPIPNGLYTVLIENNEGQLIRKILIHH
jgi:large repetitive protein